MSTKLAGKVVRVQCAADRDVAVFERLAEHFERACG